MYMDVGLRHECGVKQSLVNSANHKSKVKYPMVMEKSPTVFDTSPHNYMQYTGFIHLKQNKMQGLFKEIQGPKIGFQGPKQTF